MQRMHERRIPYLDAAEVMVRARFSANESDGLDCVGQRGENECDGRGGRQGGHDKLEESPSGRGALRKEEDDRRCEAMMRGWAF